MESGKLNTLPSMGIGLELLTNPESSRARGDTLNTLVRLIFGMVKFEEDDDEDALLLPRRELPATAAVQLSICFLWGDMLLAVLTE